MEIEINDISPTPSLWNNFYMNLSHINLVKKSLLICLFVVELMPGITWSETVAHWRFDEDGFPSGTSAPAMVDSFKDSSGKGNSMRRVEVPQPNQYSSDVPAPQVSALGKTNELSLHFPVKGEWRDIFTEPTRGINSVEFPEMTIEGAFKCESAGTFGAMVCKEGQSNPSSPFPPIQVVFARKDPDPKNLGEHLLVQWTDGSGKERMLKSLSPLSLNKWYAFAVVMTKDSASMYLQSERDKEYQLEQAVPIEGGAMTQSMGSWVLGRGFWNGKIDNPYCGWLDEIRVSNDALPKEKFLFSKP